MESASVVLVTNVGQGFGRAIALAFGTAGVDVVCADQDVDLASKTAAEIEEHGGQAIPIQADMSTQMDVLNAFSKVFEIFGALDGVVHVITLESHTPFLELSEGEFAELMFEDLRSTFLTLKIAGRLLDKGWIVLVAPPASAGQPQMQAVRGAIGRLVASMAASSRLRINMVVPSRTPSDPHHDAPLVAAVRHLASSEAVGIEGHDIAVRLPPPPRVVEALLPEVRAALDATVRQDDLEASLYDNGEGDEGREDDEDDEDDGGGDGFDLDDDAETEDERDGDEDDDEDDGVDDEDDDEDEEDDDEVPDRHQELVGSDGGGPVGLDAVLERLKRRRS